jgi:hypothetical protein
MLYSYFLTQLHTVPSLSVNISKVFQHHLAMKMGSDDVCFWLWCITPLFYKKDLAVISSQMEFYVSPCVVIQLCKKITTPSSSITKIGLKQPLSCLSCKLIWEVGYVLCNLLRCKKLSSKQVDDTAGNILFCDVIIQTSVTQALFVCLWWVKNWAFPVQNLNQWRCC